MSAARVLASAHALSVQQPILRWTDNRKREVLGAIAGCLVTAEQMVALHDISSAELELWRVQFDADGGFVGRCYAKFGHNGVYR